MSDPAGYAPHASGLLVPDEFRREREVWTREDLRLIDKATVFLDQHGVEVYLRCSHEGCHGAPMERIRNLDGGITYRCHHRDRVVVKFPSK